MPRELHDHYFREAKREGYLSRAAYKLIEIDDRKKVLRRGDRVLDCGAAPGSWLQVASQRVGRSGIVVGIDLQRITHTFPTTRGAAVRCVEGDFLEADATVLLEQAGMTDGRARFDAVLSDMAPSTTGDRTIDHHHSVRLCRAVLERCPRLLKRDGALVLKVLEGEAYAELLAEARSVFDRVKGFKPKASRSDSTEMYIVAGGFDPSGGVDDADSAETGAETVAGPRPSPPPGWRTR